MGETVKLFIVVGEPSGDLLGAGLVRNMRAYCDVEITGVGGEALVAEGLNPEFPMSDLAVMGYVDVLKRLPLLLRRARQTISAILDERPDVVVLVDAQEFSKKIASGLAKRRPDLPVVLYVAPSVWAWKPKRAARLDRYYDDILCLFPFEPQAIEKLGGMPTSYVGHPALALTQGSGKRASGRQSNLIILMPGSRTGEIERHDGLLFDVAERLLAREPGLNFVVPALAPHRAGLEAEAARRGLPFDVLSDRGKIEHAMHAAALAVVCSGTATLELAVAGVPMVVVYVPDRIMWRRYVNAGRPATALPNILTRSALVPELVSRTLKADTVAAEAVALRDGPEKRAEQREGFARLIAYLERGERGAPRISAAVRVLELARAGKNS